MVLDELSKRVYEEELSPFLPDKIIDMHVHIGLPEHVGYVRPERIAAMWALEVAKSYSWEQMRESFELFFPGKQVSALAFGFPYQEVDLDKNNAYVLDGGKNPVNRSRVLMVTKPEWNPEVLEQGLSDGFVGIKPYPDFAPGGYGDVSIFDFLPKEHLRVIDDAGAVIVLHLPRAGRIADPNNIREILDIYESYPNIKLIVAHIGRAFCLPTAQKGLPELAHATRLYYDIAANLNSDVFKYALDTVGSDRIIYGSDLPIVLMHGMREHVGEKYINFTDGPYSWNTNRKSPEEEAEYTYFIYEELRAICRAAVEYGNPKETLEKIMYSNAAILLGV